MKVISGTLWRALAIMFVLLFPGRGSCVWAQEKTVIYEIASKDAVTVKGDAPTGSSVTYIGSGDGRYASGESATMTLSGYAGCTITKIQLSTHSNAKAGAGSFTVTAGQTKILNISGSYKGKWSNAYAQNFETITPTMSNTSYKIGAGENVVLTLAATVNSLYWQSATITYEGEGSAYKDAGLSLAESSISMTAKETKTLALAKATSAMPSFSYSQAGIVECSYNNGIISVTGKAAGSTTVTVNTATVESETDDERYAPGSVTFKVKVSKINATLSFDAESAIYNYGQSFVSPVLTVSPADAPVIYTSSNESVATVDNEGNITYVAAGNTIITAKVGDENVYEGNPVSYSLTVCNPNAISWNDILTTSVLELPRNGKYSFESRTSISPASYSGYVGVSQDGTYIILNSEAGIVANYSGGRAKSIAIEWYPSSSNGYEIVVYGSDKQYSSKDDLYDKAKQGKEIARFKYNNTKVTYQPVTIDGDYQYIGLRTTESSKAAPIYSITITWAKAEKVTIGNTGYATLYYSDKSLVASKGVEAYGFTYNNDNHSLNAVQIQDGIIPAGEAVMLYTTQPGEYLFEETISAGQKVEGNCLLGTDEDVTVVADEDDYLYILGSAEYGIGFYMASEDGKSFTNGAHKAYLSVPYNVDAQVGAVRALFPQHDNTAVETVKAADRRDEVYSISGIKLKGMTRPGLYVVNGKKIVKR